MNTIYILAAPYAGESHQLLVPSFWNKQQSEISTALLYLQNFFTIQPQEIFPTMSS